MRSLLATFAVLVTTIALPETVSVAIVGFSASAGPVGGGSGSGLVRLDVAAPSGGLAVAITSNSAAVLLPTSVSVPAGAFQATFAFTTTPVATSTPVTVTVSAAGTSRSASFTLQPPGVSSFRAGGPTTITGAVGGGPAVPLLIRLSGRAPTGGLVVPLSSNNAVLTVPANVTVPAGDSSVTFSATTQPVSGAPIQVVLSAGAPAVSFTLPVVPPIIGAVAVSSTSIVGGQTVNGTVNLSQPAPSGGATIRLSSSDPAAVVPAVLSIPAGQSSASFSITTVPQSQTRSATVRARTDTTTAPDSVRLTVTRPLVSSLSAATRLVGDATTDITITLSGPAPAEGIPVDLTASAPNLLSMAATATVAGGQTTGKVSVRARRTTVATPVQVIATTAGVSRQHTVTVDPIATQSISLSSNDVPFFSSVRGTFLLNTTLRDTMTVRVEGRVTTLDSARLSTGTNTGAFSVVAASEGEFGPNWLRFTPAGGKRDSVSFNYRRAIPKSVVRYVPQQRVIGGRPVSIDLRLESFGLRENLGITARSSSPKVTIDKVVLDNRYRTVPRYDTLVTISVNTLPVTSEETVTITVETVGAPTFSTTLTVAPVEVQNLTFQLSTVHGGQGISGVVQLNAPVVGTARIVALKITSAGVASAPQTITIPVGENLGAFTIVTSAVTTNTVVTVNASTGAADKKTATFTVTP